MQRLQFMPKNDYVSRTEKCAVCRLPLLQGDQHIQIRVVGRCGYRSIRHISVSILFKWIRAMVSVTKSPGSDLIIPTLIALCEIMCLNKTENSR